MRGVQREIVIFSCYLPPKINKVDLDTIMETLTDLISEARAKTENPWVIVAGDWNRYDTTLITAMYPDIIMKNTEPTRGRALLDYSFANFDIEKAVVSFPVESETGTTSDHAVVNFECLLERPANFTWETHEYLQITEEGIQNFCTLIKNEN